MNKSTLLGVYASEEYKRSKKVVVLGGYGFGNLGDEAALSILIKRVKESMPASEITIFSYDPDETRRMHGVTAYRQMSFRMPLALIKADVCIIGGAGLINKSNFFGSRLEHFPMYLCPGAPTLLLGLLAKSFKKKVVFYAVGTTAVPDPILRILLPLTANLSDTISVRDFLSKKVLEELGVKKKIHVVPEPTLDLKPINAEKARQLLQQENVDLNKFLVGLSLRYVGDERVNRKLVRVAHQLIDWLVEELDAEVIFFPMSRHKCKRIENDQFLGEEIYRLVKHKERFKMLKKKYTPQNMKGVIGQMRLFIGMRLHSLVFSSSMKVPFIGIIYDEKVWAFLEEIDQKGIELSGVSFEKMKSYILSIFEN